MKRSPLRRTRMVKRPARRIAARAEWQPFRDWLHLQQCVGVAPFPSHVCQGEIQQSHGPKLGMGMKAPEEESWPACRSLHLEQWEAHAGYFWGWSKEARREFSKMAAEKTQQDWKRYQGGES